MTVKIVQKEHRQALFLLYRVLSSTNKKNAESSELKDYYTKIFGLGDTLKEF